MNRELQKFLPDISGGNITLASFRLESLRHSADHPSRNKEIPPPAEARGRLAAFIQGAGSLVEEEVLRRWRRGRWYPKAIPPLGRASVDFASV